MPEYVCLKCGRVDDEAVPCLKCAIVLTPVEHPVGEARIPAKKASPKKPQPVKEKNNVYERMVP